MNNDNNSKQVTIYVPVVPEKIGELYIKILVKFEEEIALKDIEVQKYFMRLLVDESVEFDIKERLIQKVNTVIEDIKVIGNNDVQDLLFKYK